VNGLSQVPGPVRSGRRGMVHCKRGSPNCLLLAGAIGIPVGVLGGVYCRYGSARDQFCVAGFLADSQAAFQSNNLGQGRLRLVVCGIQRFLGVCGGSSARSDNDPTDLRTTEEVFFLLPTDMEDALRGCQPWKTIVHM